MAINELSLDQQGIILLAALVLFSSFSMLAQPRLLSLVNTFALQGLLLSATTVLVALVSGHHHLYLSALLTLLLKALLIPWMLRRLVNRLGLHGEIEPLERPNLVLLGAAALVVFCYYVSLPIVQLSTMLTRNTIAISMSVVLLGMLMMIARRQVVAHVVGFMSIENGLFFAAVVSTYGMPMVVELGIAFDVLVAAVLFGVFFFHIRESIDSLDVDRLNRLSEVER
ncbi:MAG: formate hydrogenlyase [Gammaproteobacteria bacterium]|nr:MAG: formate hydrogenlyase [Gammaproteobacteria bacterium]